MTSKYKYSNLLRNKQIPVIAKFFSRINIYMLKLKQSGMIAVEAHSTVKSAFAFRYRLLRRPDSYRDPRNDDFMAALLPPL